ncbi:MAG: class I SAM-dependent methyltransferase [Prolixibacteraceae bacterium]|nr:class I SAM-dependent methyltransferase [Prolixibacteraceae bacterium]MBN2774081.1 class I SAM-dependent methyltransferase [Prolixibacteraceae bacterium]
MVIKKHLIRKLKGLFFRLKLHVLIPDKFLSFLAQMSEVSRWINRQKIDYTDFYSWKFDYTRRYDLYKYVIEKEGLETEFDYLEFGVAKGWSFKWWVKNIHNSNTRFYGFDTFSGLPEDWGPFKKGDMNNKNEPPEINDPRCIFYQGLFQQTLPGFLSNYDKSKRKVIHMDAALYSSTYYVLTSIAPFINKGDIIIFDEFNVPSHEFKAFMEWIDSYYIDFELLGAVNNFYQIAVKII